jgi:hypothetical protein
MGFLSPRTAIRQREVYAVLPQLHEHIDLRAGQKVLVHPLSA